MLEFLRCLRGHKWGEERTEHTHAGRRVYQSCTKCPTERTIADIRTLDADWPAHRASRAS